MTLHKDSIHTIKKIRELAPRTSKIVFISGVFNIIHPGHARLLHYASEQGDYVVVGILSNALNEKIFINEEERLEALKGIEWVDYPFVLRDEPSDFIKSFCPDVVVKGREFQNQTNPELEVLNNYGGRLLFSSGEMQFSSIDLIRKDIFSAPQLLTEKQHDYLFRHGVSFKDLHSTIKNFSELKVIVIGDIIVDEYINCDTVGLSQEDPTIVVRPILNECFVGGAGIVACHAASMGANVDLYSVVGEDSLGIRAVSQLKDYGVDVHANSDKTRPTTLKRRYRSSEKTLLRVNEFSQQSINEAIQNKIYKSICSRIDSGIDLLIFSDFSYGSLPQQLVDKLIDVANKAGVTIVADSQCSSQVGDISRFNNIKYISPTEHEARIAVRDSECGLVVLAEKLRNASNVEYVVLTLGSEGLLITSGNKEDNEWITDRLLAMNPFPKDPAGAGDAFMVVSALCIALERSIWESAYLGSLAAACQVGRLGNIPLTIDEMLFEIRQ